MPVFRRALLFPNRIALQDEVGVYTYAALHHAATSLSKEIAAQLCKFKQLEFNPKDIYMNVIFYLLSLS